MTTFLAEIAENFDTVSPTPSDEHASSAVGGNRGIIYEIDISDHPAPGGDNYWLDWGFAFDSFAGDSVMLYFGVFLPPAGSMASLRSQPNTLYVSGRTVFIHIPRHPWVFPEYSTSSERVVPFLSGPLDPFNNPSNNFIRETRALVRLEVPSFTVRLSDPISGINLNQGFSVALKNNDGFFDDENLMNIFNTPCYLKKASVENPGYGDFKLIRNGLVENRSASFDSVVIDVADSFRALQDPVCGVVRRADFGFGIRDDALGRPIPIVFGSTRIRLVRLDETRYIAGANVLAIGGVFDRSGGTVAGTAFDSRAGILTVPNAGIEAWEADVTSMAGADDPGNMIGHALLRLFEERAGLAFNETNFNTGEWLAYANGSFRVNIAITGGTVRQAMEGILRSDMAFLVQQTDGRFSIRSYANRGGYPLHEIPAWQVTQAPTSDYRRAQDNYFSSCVINFSGAAGERLGELYDDRAADAERRYRRRVRRVFETDLASRGDARALAGVLSDRYTNMRPVIKVGVGVNTAGFELLDRVRVGLDINGRKFSRITDFIVTEINHAQDTLSLEAI